LCISQICVRTVDVVVSNELPDLDLVIQAAHGYGASLCPGGGVHVRVSIAAMQTRSFGAVSRSVAIREYVRKRTAAVCQRAE